MKRYVRKSSLVLSTVLYCGGIAVILFAFPYLIGRITHADGALSDAWVLRTYWLFMLSGLAMVIAGATWRSRIYRCPKCGGKLLRLRGVCLEKASQFCPDCGTEVEVCFRERQS